MAREGLPEAWFELPDGRRVAAVVSEDANGTGTFTPAEPVQVSAGETIRLCYRWPGEETVSIPVPGT